MPEPPVSDPCEILEISRRVSAWPPFVTKRRAMLPAHNALDLLADLVLHREDPTPVLIGVDGTAGTLRLHVVPLHADDPVEDLGHLVVPDHWHSVLVGVEARAHEADGRVHEIRVVHGRNRGGDEVTRARVDTCARSLHVLCGPLQLACERLLAEVRPRRFTSERRS